MRPRVLILARANPVWTQYYIEAFRRAAEVCFVGPPLTRDMQRKWFPTGRIPTSIVPDVAVDFDVPVDWRQVSLKDFVPQLVVGISGLGGDPLPDTISGFACPTAYVTVDTWQCILNYPEARRFDYVFAAQREFVPRLRSVGARNVQWLPLACAPEHHYPVDIGTDADIAFAGSLTSDIHAGRRATIETARARFSVAAQENAMGDEACRAYARGRLGLNHCAVDEINMRVFEVMAMRRPLLVNRGPARNGLLDLFEEDRHLVVYDDAEDLVCKARRYLADSSVCKAVAEAGYAEVLATHTYRHRVAEILRVATDAPTKLVREHARIIDFLPHAPGRILDIGMRLEASRYALRRMGASWVTGISDDEAVRSTRRTSYDDASPWPPTGEFGTVVVSDAAAVNQPLVAILKNIAAVTAAGSVLILRSEHNPPCPAHVREFGFHVIHSRDTAVGHVTIARRMERTIQEVVFETFASHPETGYDAAEIVARVPGNL